MTKARKPLFSLEAKGKLGPVVITRLRDPLSKVSVKRPPANPKSPAQLNQRANYTAALEVWHTLTPAQKQEYYLMNPQIGAAPAYLNFMKVFLLSVPDQLDTLIARLNSLITLMAAGLPLALATDSLKTREQAPLTGLATSAKQDTQISALQLIDDLRAALGSVNTDDLQVDVKTMPTVTVQAAGGNKPLSIELPINDHTENTNLAAGFVIHPGSTVPTGKMWVISHISWQYIGTIPAIIYFVFYCHPFWFYVHTWLTPSSGIYYDLPFKLYLPAGTVPALCIADATLGDDIVLNVFGHQMDAP